MAQVKISQNQAALPAKGFIFIYNQDLNYCDKAILMRFTKLYKILSGEWEIRVNKNTLAKLFKKAIRWLVYVVIEVFRTGRK